MKIKLTHKDISEVSNKLGKLITGNLAIPVLKGILVKAEESAIMFTASDGTDTIIVRLQVEGETRQVIEAGSIVIAREALAIAKKLTGEIVLKLDGTNLLVEQDKSKFSFPTMAADEYPLINTDNAKLKYIISGAEFESFVKKTTFAASDSDSRPVLQAVNMSFSKEEKRYCSTDSHRLALVTSEGDESIPEDERFEINVPAKSLEQAVKSFDLTKDVIMMATNNDITLANGNTIMICRLIEGNYPDTRRLIPDSTPFTLRINRKELMDALEILQSLDKSGVVKLTVGTLFVELLASGEGNRGIREIAFEEWNGEEKFSISFSSKYILETLKSYEGATSINLGLTDVMKPIILTNPKDDNSLQLVLPIRNINN